MVYRHEIISNSLFV